MTGERTPLHHAIAWQLRHRAEASHSEIADALSEVTGYRVAPNTAGSYLRGDRRMYIDTFIDVCRAIGADPCDVLRAAEAHARASSGEDVA